MTAAAPHNHIAQLTQHGWTATQIANHLNITTRTVQRARNKTGVAKQPARQLTSDERQTIGDMLHDGASYKEVARTTGRSTTHLRRAFPGHTYTPEQTATARTIGKTMARIERNTHPPKGTPTK